MKTRENYMCFPFLKRLKIDISRAISKNGNFDFFINASINSMIDHRNTVYIESVKIRNRLRRVDRITKP
jgi:hypothetical protein